MSTATLEQRFVPPKFTPIDGVLRVTAAYTPVDHVHGPDSTYVRYFWLPLLGPSASLAWSHLAGWVGTEADDVVLSVGFDEFAHSLGLQAGRLNLALGRLCRFYLAHTVTSPSDTIRIVRRAPPLSARQLGVLSGRCPTLAAAHHLHREPVTRHDGS